MSERSELDVTVVFSPRSGERLIGATPWSLMYLVNHWKPARR